MSKLSFAPVDQIHAATGENHYYRVFQIEEETWIVYVHQFDQVAAARGFLPDPFVYTSSSLEAAQVFAQAFEDDAAEKSAARRVAHATRVACGETSGGVSAQRKHLVDVVADRNRGSR